MTAAAAGCICNSERGACSSPHPVRTGWMDGWMGLPAFRNRAGLWGGIYRASRRLGRRSLFRLRPPSLSSTAPPPLWFSFSFLFFLLDPNKKKFHNNSTRNRRPFSTRSHSFPFYYYFIIPKVTALGARTTTTTFYLMSWFWGLDVTFKIEERGATIAR